MNLRTEILPSDEVGDMISFGVNGQRLFLLGILGLGTVSLFAKEDEKTTKEKQEGTEQAKEDISQKVYEGDLISLTPFDNLLSVVDEINEQMDQGE